MGIIRKRVNRVNPNDNLAVVEGESTSNPFPIGAYTKVENKIPTVMNDSGIKAYSDTNGKIHFKIGGVNTDLYDSFVNLNGTGQINESTYVFSSEIDYDGWTSSPNFSISEVNEGKTIVSCSTDFMHVRKIEDVNDTPIPSGGVYYFTLSARYKSDFTGSVEVFRTILVCSLSQEEEFTDFYREYSANTYIEVPMDSSEDCVDYANDNGNRNKTYINLIDSSQPTYFNNGARDNSYSASVLKKLINGYTANQTSFGLSMIEVPDYNIVRTGSALNTNTIQFTDLNYHWVYYTFSAETDTIQIPKFFLAMVPQLMEIRTCPGITGFGSGVCLICDHLSSVTLDNSFAEIGDASFLGCTRLKDFNFNQVTKIGNEAFCLCTNLSGLTNMDKVELMDDYAFSMCNSLTSFTIPSGLSEINEGMFAGSINLVNVNVYNTITSIGRYAFQNCKRLTGFTFYNSSSLAPISYPNGVFQNCFVLTKNTGLRFDTPSSYGICSFANCNSLFNGLATVDMQNCIYVCDFAFMNILSGRTSGNITFNFGRNFSVIGSYGFYANNCMKKIKIFNNDPSSHIYFYNGCFSYCRKMETYDFSQLGAIIPYWMKENRFGLSPSTFEGVDYNDFTILIPHGQKTRWKKGGTYYPNTWFMQNTFNPLHDDFMTKWRRWSDNLQEA